MKNFLLTKIRLSTYFWFFFVLYLGSSYLLPHYKFDSGTLTLFSVNSFLYGFYISPILGAQKTRIDSLHQSIRSEANALFGMALNLKKLPDDLHDRLQGMLENYIHAKLRHRGINGGEEQYEALITYCVEDYKGAHKERLDDTLKSVVANQQNRTTFNMLMGGKVFANEWHIIAILFSITLGFILLINTSNLPLLHIVRALLATGLTMLIVNLIKLSTLTHKKAKQMWEPLQKLVTTNFYRID
ncbi:MAG TPA: hypothetical protein VLE99_03800 [Candidatus Saccharimonadales bacterium]|nr:hypothetical protein [Candidatus Saccharimonadales bacterium]